MTYLVNIPPKELYFLYHFCSLCTNRMTRIKNIAVPDDLVFFLSIVNTITGALPACAVPMMHFSNNTAGATGWLRDEKRAELVWYVCMTMMVHYASPFMRPIVLSSKQPLITFSSVGHP